MIYSSRNCIANMVSFGVKSLKREDFCPITVGGLKFRQIRFYS